MHELSICHSIAAIVQRHSNGQQVTAVRLEVGQLRQIVPETLVHCWALVCADTPLAGSHLDVTEIPARLDCTDCGADSLVGPFPVFRCGSCAGDNVAVIAGEEFLITSMDVSERTV